jgi:hypothetical protein
VCALVNCKVGEISGMVIIPCNHRSVRVQEMPLLSQTLSTPTRSHDNMRTLNVYSKFHIFRNVWGMMSAGYTNLSVERE